MEVKLIMPIWPNAWSGKTRRVAPIRTISIGVAAVLLLGISAPASAEGFISPYLGYNFGGDSGCPTIANCEDKKLNVGVALGSLGSAFGLEADFAYAKDFFGSAPGFDSNVLTAMGNVMFVPKIGPVRPYVLGGIGLIKAHAALTTASVFASDNNTVGWDLGGGVMVFFGSHVGIRGDVRYFHSFQDLTLLGFSLSNTKLDFGRASAGLVLKF
jgi:opacity protein-like surface antigen